MGRILVVGRSGQLARALAAIDGLYEMIALGRADFDLSRPAAVIGQIQQVQPAGVINAAAYTAVDKAETDAEAAFALNRDGPAALAAACATLDIPLVHVSTDYVFDGTKPSAYVETDLKAPLGVYGRSKSAGEDAVLGAHDRVCVLRTSWVYSPVGANFVKTMLRLAALGRDEISVVADQHGRPTAAADLAQACLAALGGLQLEGARVGGVYHYAGAGDAVWADVAACALEAARDCGLPSARVRRITTAEYPTPARRPANSRLDSDKFAATFGYPAQDWKAGVAACVRALAAEASALGSAV